MCDEHGVGEKKKEKGEVEFACPSHRIMKLVYICMSVVASSSSSSSSFFSPSLPLSLIADLWLLVAHIYKIKNHLALASCYVPAQVHFISFSFSPPLAAAGSYLDLNT